MDIDFETKCDDGTLSKLSPLAQWQQLLLDTTERTGKPLRYERRTRDILKEAGFVDIQEIVIRVPINSWPADPDQKEHGRWYQLVGIEGLEALSLGPLTRVQNWTAEQVKNLLGPVKRDIMNKNIHGYNNV